MELKEVFEEIRNKNELIRIEYAKKKLSELNLPILSENKTTLIFEFKGNKITLFPYTGWHSGKGIKAGRGIKNLLKQLKKAN